MNIHRIVMLTAQFMPEANGGAEKQCLKLSLQLQQHGYQVIVLTSRKSKSLPAREIVNGLTVIRLLSYGPPQLLSVRYLHSSIIWLIKCFRWLKKNQASYDLIHMHQAKFNAVAGLMASSYLKKRSLVKIGNSGSGFDLHTLRRKALIGKALHRYVINRIDIVIAISQDIRQELIDENIPLHKILFLPNGVETKISHPISDTVKLSYRKQLKLPANTKIFLFAGRLEKQKDVLSLVLGFALCNPQKNNFFLVLLGEGELRTEVEAVIREQNLENFISLRGFQKNVWPYLLASDFFVLSTKAEGLSNALLEAMSAGLIPISTEVSGSKDLITPGTNGFLTQLGSYESLGKAISSAGALSPYDTEKFRNYSFRIIKENYDIRVITKKYLALYDQMLTV